jgi:cytochrome c peroxidase
MLALLPALLCLTAGSPTTAQLSNERSQEPIAPILAPPAQDQRRVLLGELLFRGQRLSHDSTRSCSTCHDVQTNAASASARDLAFDGQALALNTLTVFNASLSFRLNLATTPPYFHDGSAATLPDAVKAMGRAQLDRVLTEQQVAAIVAFLNTLTGAYRGHAIRPAPAASDKARP